MQRCEELGAISDEPGRLTRTFGSPAMARVNRRVGAWMRSAGLNVRIDAALNLWGHWPCARRGVPTLVVGSHLDTVPDAGKYDGPLGVLTALAAVAQLRAQRVALPFHLDVIGFSDEEGVRHQTAYLGSGAVAGTLTRAERGRLGLSDLAKARRAAREILGYVEVHIEQGPVLEQRHLPLGVVSAIVGQTRVRVEIEGRAGHAGTVPMNARHDALCGAAEIVLAAERSGVTATVGKIEVAPGAPNVIPGRAVFTLDVRHARDGARHSAVRGLRAAARHIARTRRLRLTWSTVQDTPAVGCDPAWTTLLASCVSARGFDAVALPSGAGHDAVSMSALGPVAMLFVRCRGGISHHPDESVKTADVRHAIAVLTDFIETLAARHA
jgi:allantoate deiminase